MFHLSAASSASMRAARVGVGVCIRFAKSAAAIIWITILWFWRKQSRLRHGLMARGFGHVLTRILRRILT